MSEPSTPDFVQQQLGSVLIQGAVIRPVTMDVARAHVSVPDDYPRNNISVVPSIYRGMGLIVPTAVCRSSRPVARSAKCLAWICVDRERVARWVTAMREALGPAFVPITAEMLEAYELSVLAPIPRRKKKKGPPDNQMDLFAENDK